MPYRKLTTPVANNKTVVYVPCNPCSGTGSVRSVARHHHHHHHSPDRRPSLCTCILCLGIGYRGVCVLETQDHMPLMLDIPRDNRTKK